MTWGDQTFVGTFYSKTNAVEERGRFRRLGERVVAANEIVGGLPTLPATPPRRARRVFEVPAGADADAIQQILDEAARLAGQRPVVHLPMGRYPIARTLRIPADCDLQLVGDGFNAFGTRLEPMDGTLPALVRLVGPSRATLRDLHMGGVWEGTGITIENCDQPGARVFMEQVYLSGIDLS